MYCASSEYQSIIRVNERRGRQRFPSFADWLEDRVRDMGARGLNPPDDLVTMSHLPSPHMKRHPSMWSRGYHYRADSEQGKSNISFDAGVAAKITQTCRSSRSDLHPVEAELQYFGVIREILKVDYGHIPFILLKCSWIKPHLEGSPTIRVDEDGFTSVKYHARQTLAHEPYIFPKDTTQVRFQKLTSCLLISLCFKLSTLIAYSDRRVLFITSGRHL